jgi:hypothetical protein
MFVIFNIISFDLTVSLTGCELEGLLVFSETSIGRFNSGCTLADSNCIGNGSLGGALDD